MQNVKLYAVVIIALSLGVINTAYGQQSSIVAQSFSDVCANSGEQTFAQLFDDEVELDAPTVRGTYKHELAVNSFTSFINNLKPTEFKLKHKGASGQGQVYAIGHMATESGVQYKIVLRARNMQGSYKIFQLNVTQL